MRILPITNQYHNRKNVQPAFKSTTYEDKKIIERDVFSITGETSLFSNPISPSQNILGVRIVRENNRTVNLVSRYNNKTGQIQYNPQAQQPEVNIQVGSFQPIIEIKDKELGLTILMTRGANLSGENLSIQYKELANNSINFDYVTSPKITRTLGNTNSNNLPRRHTLVVTTGYMPEKTQDIVEQYQKLNKSKNVYVNEQFARTLTNDYTIVGLGGGMGTRLKPISDLGGNNKPSTPYPGGDKTLLELAVLDTAHTAGGIGEIRILHDNKKDLLNTAGIVIKGINEGTIDTTKPLVLLTGDTCNNIDLARALHDFEKDKNCGMALVVNKVTDVRGKSCVKFDRNNNLNSHKITGFSSLVTGDNQYGIKSYYGVFSNEKQKNEYYSSTNAVIISPQVLKILEKFANPDGSADFIEFLGLMYNVMNNTQVSLYSLYPQGLKAPKLNLYELMEKRGEPTIKNSNGERMYLTAIIAKDVHGNDAVCEDIGTIEDYVKTIKEISKDTTFNPALTRTLNENINKDGILFFDKSAQAQMQKFKEKYSINNINGNVIVYSSQPAAVQPPIPEAAKFEPQIFAPTKELYAKTSTLKDGIEYISQLMRNPRDLHKTNETMLEQYGAGFLEWYMSPKGYYGAYEAYVEDLFKNADSIDDLLKFMPNWAPWKLEEKLWLLKHPYYANSSNLTRKTAFDSSNDLVREQNFAIGTLPTAFQSELAFIKLIEALKTSDIKEGSISCGNSYFWAKRLKGGELNDKFIYLLTNSWGKYILKFDRTNVEDAHSVNGRNLSLYEKKNIRKNKYLAADSIYSNACISRYLELNNCQNIPRLYYYNQSANAAIYEYVEDKDKDLFQNNMIDEEYSGLTETNEEYRALNELGIYLNDTALKNTLTDKDGIKKIIDLGHANFIMPFKPGVKHYNIEFSNTNGPDIRSILASLAGALLTIQTAKKVLK